MPYMTLLYSAREQFWPVAIPDAAMQRLTWVSTGISNTVCWMKVHRLNV